MPDVVHLRPVDSGEARQVVRDIVAVVLGLRAPRRNVADRLLERCVSMVGKPLLDLG